MPKCSVVVPVYNVERYVEKCADSILAQTEQDLELILVDDGSTDSSGALCDRIAEKDPRVRVIHQENAGLGGARNTGIEAAKGRWLLFVDSDDWIEPGILEQALQAAAKTGAEISLFAFRTVDEAGNELEVFRENVEKDRALRPQAHPEIFLTAPCAWNKLYDVELFRKTGVRYPPRVWYEDIRTTLKLFLAAESVTFSDTVGYNYLMREGSITKNLNADRNGEILQAFDDILGYFREVEQFEAYRDELCFLTVFHVYLTASVRVLRIDRKHSLLPQFQAYVEREFPHWRENRYLTGLGKKRRLLLSLLEKKQYWLIRLLFRIKG